MAGDQSVGVPDICSFLPFTTPGTADSLTCLVRTQTDIREIQNDTSPLWFAGLDPKKINFGLSRNGRGYTLNNPDCSSPGCLFKGPSNPGPCTNSAGFLSSAEINDVIQQKGLKAQMVADTMSKHISWDDQWIGFDDEETLAQKTQWAENHCFGGTLINVDSHDSGGTLVSGEPSSSHTKGQSGLSVKSGQQSKTEHPSGSSHTDGLTLTSELRVSSTSSKERRPSASSVLTSGSADIISSIRSMSSGTPRSLSSGQMTRGTPTPKNIGTHSDTSTGSVLSSRSIDFHTTRTSARLTIDESVHTSPPHSTTSVTGRSQKSSKESTGSSGHSTSSTLPTAAQSGYTSTSSDAKRRTTSPTPVTSSLLKSSGSTSPSIPLSASLKPISSSSKPLSSSKTSITSFSNKPGQSTRSMPTSFSSLTTSGNSSISIPTTAPEVIVAEGATAVLGLLPLAYGIKKGFTKTKKSIDTLAESKSPTAEDTKRASEVLAGLGFSLGLFGATIPKLNFNSLPQDSKPIIRNLAEKMPSIQKGTQEAIDDLKNAIKDPKNVNIDKIRKAQQLIDRQIQQVTQPFKQLTDWKPPKGAGEMVLDSVTLPSPTLGDSFKGTKIGDISIPSPSINWNKPFVSSSQTGSTAMEGLKSLGEQAVSAVEAASSSFLLLSGASSGSIGFTTFGNLLGALTSAAEGASLN